MYLPYEEALSIAIKRLEYETKLQRLHEFFRSLLLAHKIIRNSNTEQGGT